MEKFRKSTPNSPKIKNLYILLKTEKGDLKKMPIILVREIDKGKQNLPCLFIDTKTLYTKNMQAYS